MQTNSSTVSEQLTKLAEALFRFSSGLDAAFAPHVRQIAVELAGAVAGSDNQVIAGVLKRARGVLALGERLGMIGQHDAQVIEGAIARSQNLALPVPAKQPAVDFAEIAAGDSSVSATQASRQESIREYLVDESPAKNVQPVLKAVVAKPYVPDEVPVPKTVPASPSQPGSFPAADRQSRIIAAIRQNPNARMRDLLAALPGVSERTIRYDLERLAASGKIEREGVGGPATWYRVREGVTA